jgi:DNA-binding NarL/FixJ family response regulator
MQRRAPVLEREEEFEELGHHLEGLARGQGRLVVVSGAAGVGKTTLLGELGRGADDSGFRVLQARANPRERATPYGVVRQLFDPLVAATDVADRDELFVGSAGLARHLFQEDQPGAGVTGSATVQGLWWLLLTSAERRAVTVVVDDLQWCDRESLEWLAYVARRLQGTPILLAMGVRTGDPAEDEDVLQDILEQPAAVLEPLPLGEASTRSLVGLVLGSTVAPEVATACHTATAGNPFLLWELLRALRTSGTAVEDLTASHISRIGVSAVARPLARRLKALSTDALLLARALTVLGDGTSTALAGKLAGLDPDAAEAAAQRLADADVLRLDTRPEFVHPLVGEAVYHSIPPADRAAAHVSAAALLQRSGAEVHRVAAQIHLITPGGYDDAVPVLRLAADRSFRMGARASGVTHLRRALEEPLNSRLRLEILTQLGSAETLLDGPAAVTHLREAAALTTDPFRRAEIVAVLGPALFFTQRNADAVEVYQRALAELPPTVDRSLRQRLEAGLLAAAVDDSVLFPAVRAHAAALTSCPPSECDPALAAVLAWHEARTGSSRERCVGLAGQALSVSPGGDSAAAFAYAGFVLAVADRYDEVRSLCNRALDHARATGSVFDFSIASWLRGVAAYFSGVLVRAEADQRQAIEAGEAHGLSAGLVHGYARLAEALIDQGQIADAEATLARVVCPHPLPALAHFTWYLHARGRLRLVQRRPREALDDFREAGRTFVALDGANPALLPWRSDAALAALALSDRPGARLLADDELRDAASWGAPRALGRTLRVAAATRPGGEGLDLLQESRNVLTDAPAVLERARTAVDLGIALHAAGEIRSAREHLWQGLEEARECAAHPLAARAHDALIRTGARPRRSTRSGTAALTATEQRVASMAAGNQTNREIAEALFVTPKTIELHLANAYRKLGIGSRTQLRAALDDDGASR